MTDIEKQVDSQVGLDVERERVTYLKYVNLGRQLAQEEMAATQPTITEAQLEEKLSEQSASLMKVSNDAIREAFAEVDAALKQAGVEADQVYKIDEHGAFDKLKADSANLTVPDLVAKFEVLLKNWDDKHSVIYKERLAATAAIRAKYLPEG